MKQSTFIAALKFASSAMAVKDIRYYLNGVLFEFKGSTLALVGTDGHRMAYVVLDDDNPDECVTTKCTISCDSVKLLLSAFKASSYGYIGFELVNGGLTIRGATGQAIPCTMVEGTYPDWRRVCKSGAKPVAVEEIAVKGDYLASALKACGAYADNSHGATRVIFHGASDALRIEPAPLPERCTEAAIIVMPTRV